MVNEQREIVQKYEKKINGSEKVKKAKYMLSRSLELDQCWILFSEKFFIQTEKNILILSEIPDLDLNQDYLIEFKTLEQIDTDCYQDWQLTLVMVKIDEKGKDMLKCLQTRLVGKYLCYRHHEYDKQ